jgi:hypothetical protein
MSLSWLLRWLAIILVLGRVSDDTFYWAPGEPHYALYGSRFKRIVIGLQDQVRGIDKSYIDNLRCRLDPDGEWIEVRLGGNSDA